MNAFDLFHILFSSVLLIIAFYLVMEWMNEWCERRIERLAREGATKEAVDRLYSMIWVGTKRDELPAWERVIDYLEENGYNQEMITEAKLRSLCRMKYGHNIRYRDRDNGTGVNA